MNKFVRMKNFFWNDLKLMLQPMYVTSEPNMNTKICVGQKII